MSDYVGRPLRRFEDARFVTGQGKYSADIDLPEQVLVLAEDMPVIRGQYGEYQGNTAVKVEEIVEVIDPENTEIKNAMAQQE